MAGANRDQAAAHRAAAAPVVTVSDHVIGFVIHLDRRLADRHTAGPAQNLQTASSSVALLAVLR